MHSHCRGSLPREADANLEVDSVCALCAALIIAGGSSQLKILQAHIFSSIARLPVCLLSHSVGNSISVSATTVSGADKHAYCQKRNSILTNLETLGALKQSCPGFYPTHWHESAWGSRVVQGKGCESSTRGWGISCRSMRDLGPKIEGSIRQLA